MAGAPVIGAVSRIVGCDSAIGVEPAQALNDSPSPVVDEDFVIPHISEIGRVIANPNESITKRIRYLFSARHAGGPEAVDALLSGLQDDSVLLVHEIAYVLGQLGDSAAVPALLELLRDKERDCMIRHEAAEALAAIGASEFMDELQHFKSDPCIPVSETCHLALRSLEEKSKLNTVESKESEPAPRKFNTTDPIARAATCNDVSSLATTMMNPDEDLYTRYEALFALRDLDTPQAQREIMRALIDDKSSALFRHEVAFVLGQIQTPDSIEALVNCLDNCDEHPMARHEAAFALGSASCGGAVSAAQKEFAISALRSNSNSSDRVVAESCLVGLDTIAREAPRLRRDSAC